LARPVMVVVGAGGMGSAIARRSGYGKTLVLADFDGESLARHAAAMSDDGYDVHPRQVDIGDRSSVRDLAEHAASFGAVNQMVLTAGVSPMQASIEAILRVDLVGSAIVLEEIPAVIADGGAGVMIASMSGSFVPLPPDLELALATTPADELMALPMFADGVLPNSGAAYSVAKRANQVRVRAAAVTWGQRGARINSISPGIISTAMGKLELEGESAATMQAMLDCSPVPRQGTPEDIAYAADFLLDPRSSFITGIDMLVDGGVVAAVQAGSLTLPSA
jgi:NAD(P)-dependent dehydrogenase (short-subunit alcohol dehydrogenase family)